MGGAWNRWTHHYKGGTMTDWRLRAEHPCFQASQHMGHCLQSNMPAAIRPAHEPDGRNTELLIKFGGSSALMHAYDWPS